MMSRVMVEFGTDHAFEKAARKIQEHYAQEVTAERIKNECLRVARTLPQTPQVQRTLAARGPDAIVAQADGTMIPVVQIEAPPPANTHADARKRRKTQWKEMRLVCAQARGSKTTKYGAGFDTPEQTGARLTQAVAQAGCGQNTWVHGVGDGAGWINEQFNQHFGSRGKYLLDLYHVCEYLAPCAPPGQDKTQWLEKTKEALKQNQAAQVIEELAARVEAPDLSEEQAPVRCAHRYLDKRRDQLDYKTALENDLPVGSGLIESAHRHVLQSRLKLPGAWWRPENAHAMAQLCACRANGLWEQLWHN